LRQDNADLRLTQIGNDIGTINERNYYQFSEKRRAIDMEMERLENAREGEMSLAKILKRNEVTYASLPQRDESLPEEVRQQVEVIIKYAGYIERQEEEVLKFRKMEDKQIPEWMDYNAILGLRNEARHKLSDHLPATLGQASRISGISPSDISLVMVHMKRGPKGAGAETTAEETVKPSAFCGDGQ